MAIFFGVVFVILVLVFGIASIMQSYASAQQAEAVIETAQAAQMATMGNLVVIVVMALVIVLILAGVVSVILRMNARTANGFRFDRRQDRLEAGRRYGEQLRQHLAEIEAQPHICEDESLLVVGEKEVEDYVAWLFQDGGR